MRIQFWFATIQAADQVPSLVDNVVAGVQVATLLAVIVYVWKTWHIATATKDAAKATERAARATEQSAIATQASVDELRAARREASDPKVYVYAATSRGYLFELVVENTGQSTATDARFEFSPALTASQHGDHVKGFFEVAHTLPPGSRRVHVVDGWPSYFGAGLPERYEVSVSFRRLGEADVRSELQIVDLGSFKRQLIAGRKEFHDFATDFQSLKGKVELWLQRNDQSEADRERRRTYVTSQTTLADAVAGLVSLQALRLATEADGQQSAGPYYSDFRPAMASLCVAGLHAAQRENAAPDVVDALTRIFEGLSGAGTRKIGHDKVSDYLAQALADLARLVPVSDHPRGYAPE